MSKEYIYNRLMAEIHNPYGVCGLMGNIQAEGNFNPKNMQNSFEAKLGFNDDTYTEAVDNNTYGGFQTDGCGYGLVQWTYSDRKKNMWIRSKETGKSIGDLDFQIDFIFWELKNGYKSVFNSLKNATSVREASDVVTLQYEAPRSVGKNATEEQRKATLDLRASYGEKLYKELVKEEDTKEEVKDDVTMNNGPLITYRKISPNKTSPRNHVIDTITIHCFVGQVTAESGCNAKSFTTYNPISGASCNYVVGYDGSIGLCVEEKDRSWCTSNRANDHRAITIEVASETAHPYKVTDKAMESLIELVADICKRNNIKKLVWSTNKNDRVNHLNGCNMTVHRDYKNKACPGEYLYNKHGYIAEEVNKRLGVVEKTEGNKIYRVQCGAFTNPKNAENLRARLKADGYEAIIVEV